MTLLDRAEQIVAERRLGRWPEDDRAWFERLTDDEKEVLRLLAAHFDAKPEPKDD